MRKEGGKQKAGFSFESWEVRGKERGYNLVISGGNVKGEISSESKQIDFKFLCSHPRWSLIHRFYWLNHSWTVQSSTPLYKSSKR